MGNGTRADGDPAHPDSARAPGLPTWSGRAASRRDRGSYEDVWRDRAELSDRIEYLEEELQRHRELESLLRKTLVSAEAAAEEQREQARRSAELVVSEAHAEARRITFAATAERERLLKDVRRLRELLRTALATVDETEGADEIPDEAAAA